jgi:hypothetical protein
VAPWRCLQGRRIPRCAAPPRLPRRKRAAGAIEFPVAADDRALMPVIAEPPHDPEASFLKLAVIPAHTRRAVSKCWRSSGEESLL